MSAVPLQALAGGRLVDYEPEVTADDIAVMDLLMIEDSIKRLRRSRIDIPQERIREFVSAGERLATLAKEALS